MVLYPESPRQILGGGEGKAQRHGCAMLRRRPLLGDHLLLLHLLGADGVCGVEWECGTNAEG